MKQKIFSLILGTVVGLALFFLVSSLLGTNASSSISKFKTNQFGSFKSNNTNGINGIIGESGATTYGSGINSINNRGNFTGNRSKTTGNFNFQTGGKTDSSGSKQFIIKRGNRQTTTQ